MYSLWILGSLFACMTLLQIATGFIANILLNMVYTATMNTLHGAVFLLAAGFSLLAAASAMCV